MRRLAFILAALLAASPAWAADQWNAGTLTGSGRTETLAYPATCSSTDAYAIPRRATSLSGALTRYVTTGAGDLTATTYTPASRTNFVALNSIGCDASTVIVGGRAVYVETSTNPPVTWTSRLDVSAAAVGYYGTFSKTSPDKTWIGAASDTGGATVSAVNIGFPWSVGNVASSAPAADDTELVSVGVSSSYYCSIAADYSLGQPRMRGYTSGTSFAFTTLSGSVILSAGSYYYPPFGLSATACVATVKRLSNGRTYIQSAPIGGTITGVDAGVIDLIPLGDWDPTGSLRRGWWINKADGTVRVSNSATTVASIATNATYDIGSTPLGGSTPLFAITGLDMDGDGDATDNPVVLMADGTHFAWWGTPPSTGGGYRAPKRKATGPFNSYPFSIPGALP